MGPIPASRASAETLPQTLVGRWVDHASPQPCAGGQADGEAPKRLCCLRGELPGPFAL